MNNTFLNWYCPNEGQGIGVVSYGFAPWLFTLVIVWAILLSGMVEKNGENISWVQHCQRIDAFKLWCWRRLLRVPWTARISNQSILKKINPEYSLERLMLKLKLQYFGHLMGRADSLEKTLMLGKIEDRRRRGVIEDGIVEWHHWLNRHEFEQAPGNSEGQRSLVCCSSWGHRVRHDLATEQQYLLKKKIGIRQF